MSKKHSISQLIRDEVEQQELFKLDAYTSYTTDWAVDTCSGAVSCDRSPQSQKVVLEQTTTSAPEQKHWVETYSPSTRKSHSYYRYVYMEGRTLKHLHLRGGSSTSPNAIALKEKVESAIASGKTPQEITFLIKSGSGS